MIYDVPLVPQTSTMSCWAASIAMIIGWRDSASYSGKSIAANHGGTSYMPSFKNGLDPNDQYILRQNGFLMEAPMCYTPSLVHDHLEAHGPLWVAAAVPSPHIRVIRGMEGGMLHVNDPAPVNHGRQYTRSFNQFFGRMEALGSQELNQPNPVYVAYLQ